jgi:hypothetical protein
VTMQDKVEERGDDDAGDGAKSLGPCGRRGSIAWTCQAVGRCRMELPGCGCVDAVCGHQGSVIVSLLGLHGRLGKASGGWRSRVRVDEF